MFKHNSVILLRFILTLRLSTTSFGSSYEPPSGWLLKNKVKYKINKTIFIVTYEISYNMYTEFEIKLIPL